MTARPAMSERQLDDRIRAIVRDVARLGGGWLLAYHTHNSQHSPSGFPDWTFVGPRGVMFRENKTATGKLSADQQEWLRCLNAVGANMAVWRPADLASGRVAGEICYLAGLNPGRAAIVDAMAKGSADA